MLALSALLLTAGTCAQPTDNTGVVPPNNNIVVPPNENPAINNDAALKAQNDACIKEGGHFGPGGRLQEYHCYMPTPKAGKACKTSSDCVTGKCVAYEMTCSPETPYFGCSQETSGDGNPAVLCVD